MASIVLGVGASHTTLMNTHWDAVRHRDRAERYRDALAEARDAIAAMRPDSAVIIGSNHFRGLWLDLMPAFTIGVGECVALGEAGTPAGDQPVDAALAQHICEALVADQFDPAFSARLQIDHGISHAIQYLLPPGGIPLVPVIINVFAPPLPTLARSVGFGAALRAAIGSFAADRRVAVIATGGLSHRLPWPDWRAPQGDDDAFMVEAWLNGRTRWKDYERRRREIVLKGRDGGGAPLINPEFDRDFLARLEAGTLEAAARYGNAEIESVAGNGGHEIRSWLAMAAALDFAAGRTLAYEEIPEWLCGMAVALIEPA